MRGQGFLFVVTQGFFDIVGHVSHKNALLICHGDFKVFPFKTPFYHMSKKHIHHHTTPYPTHPIKIQTMQLCIIDI